MNFSSKALISTLLFTVAGCGSGSDGGVFDPSTPRVTDLRIDPGSISVGEQALVRLAFEPYVERSFDPVTGEEDGETIHSATVVVRLPEGLDYVADTSEVDTEALDGFEKRNPNTVELCSDNSRALTYLFEGDELSSNVENQIRFTVQSYQSEGSIRVEAYADDFISIPCNITGEADEILTLR